MGPRLISRDWQGVRPPVDAAMVGRVHLSPQPTPTSPTMVMKRKSRRKRPSKKRGQRRRHSRFVWEDLWFHDDLYDDLFDYSDYSHIAEEPVTQEYKSTPVQNVYFFKKGMKTFLHTSQAVLQMNRKLEIQAKTVTFFLCLSVAADKYYRVDLRTKRVDVTFPSYPRSIAKYWLGCEREGVPDVSRAEKK